ncbi:MAG TPA: phage holin family protein [Bacillota bacterium]|nr:phage holin family protein [Bacillota bacterium]
MDWLKLKYTVGFAGACTIETLAACMGGWDVWLKALVLFVVLDYLSGVLAAGVQKKLDSSVGYKGIAKKVFIFILVAVAVQVDILAGSNVIRLAVVGFSLGIEGLSILENAGRAGIPLPEPLINALVQLKDKSSKKG